MIKKWLGIIIISTQIHANFQLSLSSLKEKQPHLFIEKSSSTRYTKNDYYQMINMFALTLGVGLCAKSYYDNYHATANKSYTFALLHQILPSLISNSSNHVNFLLQSGEGLLQAYILKIIGNLIVWGFIED